MRLKLYQCDMCEKEHRRGDIVNIAYHINGLLKKPLEHLCSVCEDIINKAIDEVKAKRKDNL
jgi:hypothetical protein